MLIPGQLTTSLLLVTIITDLPVNEQ